MLLAWVCYFSLVPFYVFRPGLPQPGDMIALSGIMLLFLSYMISPVMRVNPAFFFAGIFALLTLVINLLHYLFLPDMRFLLSSVYYIYNFGLFMLGVTLFASNPILTTNIARYILAALIVIQVFYAHLMPNIFSWRESGSFFTPNQLAYWTLLAATSYVVLKREQPFNLFDIGLLIIAGYLQILSLSKAGMITYALFLVFLLFHPSFARQYLLVACIIFVGIIAFVAKDGMDNIMYTQELSFLDKAMTRLENIGAEKDDNLEARGYLRLLDYPQYLLLGAGEGGFERFGRLEIHSGLATILFSYSIFGFAFFLTFLFFVFNKLPWYYWLLMIPILLFGLVHQNVRFGFFWTFLSIMYSQHIFENMKLQTQYYAAQYTPWNPRGSSASSPEGSAMGTMGALGAAEGGTSTPDSGA